MESSFNLQMMAFQSGSFAKSKLVQSFVVICNGGQLVELSQRHLLLILQKEVARALAGFKHLLLGRHGFLSKDSGRASGFHLPECDLDQIYRVVYLGQHVLLQFFKPKQ